MEHEIDTAQGEVKRLEDQTLELMVAGDDITAALKGAEGALKTAKQQTVRDRADPRQAARSGDRDGRRAYPARRRCWLRAWQRGAGARRTWRRADGQGIAAAVARDERCSECYVACDRRCNQHIRENNSTIQCDSWQRVLYFIPPKAEASRHCALGMTTVVHRWRVAGQSGPAGYGVQIVDGEGQAAAELHRALDHATNNVAEYQGLLAALAWALDQGIHGAAHPLRFRAAGPAIERANTASRIPAFSRCTRRRAHAWRASAR